MDYELFKDTSSVLDAFKQVNENTMPVNTKGKSFEELAEYMEESVKAEAITESASFQTIIDTVISESVEVVETSHKNALLTIAYMLKENYNEEEISGELLKRIKSLFNKEIVKENTKEI